MELNDAIQHLKESLADTTHQWGCEECKQEHEQLLEWLEDYKQLRDANSRADSRWILATEKLPSSYDPVLVYGKEYDMFENHWDTTFMILVYFWKHKEWSTKSRFKALAWMPLPTPPKGES